MRKTKRPFLIDSNRTEHDWCDSSLAVYGINKFVGVVNKFVGVVGVVSVD